MSSDASVDSSVDAAEDGASIDARMDGPSMDATTSDVSVPDVSVDVPECTPRECAADACGAIDDGCGAVVDCGGCAAGTCVANRCLAGEPGPVDCSGIESRGFELCEESETQCAGVFENGEGCTAFCAAAGLDCVERRGGEPGCSRESDLFACDADNGHLSDWCVCARGDEPVDPPGECEGRGRRVAMGFRDPTVVYENRRAWVLLCRPDYAYTAQFEEHEECDSQYRHGSGRGSATFSFDVPSGEYRVIIRGRHTENRNPAGMRTVVQNGGEEYVRVINQRDESGAIQSDLHGTYCLEGRVDVVIDSSVSAESDSVAEVILEPT